MKKDKSNKAIKYRIYPNKEQAVMFAKTFGCCRKVWNLMLSDKIEYYRKHGEQLANTPAQYKEEYPYLREVDSLALANVQMHLKSAFSNFYSKKRKKNTGFPRFKSKKCRNSYTTNNQKGSVAIIDNTYIKLPKLGKIKAKIHRIPDESWTLKSATISKDPDGKYYASVLFEYEEISIANAYAGNTIGLDYKSDGLYTDDNGNVCGSPKYYRRSQKRLARLQRQLSRKQKGSKNREKARLKVAKLQKHTVNQRNDFLHKKSTEIANLYDIVCVETLDMKAMSNKGFGNGKATLDNGYGMFLSMLKYKLEDRNKAFVQIDKWYPSSQLCCKCGRSHPEMKDLQIRIMDCGCGNRMDRDANAAINIKKEGIRMLTNAA